MPTAVVDIDPDVVGRAVLAARPVVLPIVLVVLVEMLRVDPGLVEVVAMQSVLKSGQQS